MHSSAAKRISERWNVEAAGALTSNRRGARAEPMPRLLVFGKDSVALAFRLREMGYWVSSAQGPYDQLLKQILRDQPDLVLIDIDANDPEADIALAKRIKKFHDLSLLYASGGSQGAGKPHTDEAPFNYVVKPLDNESLRLCIKLAVLANAGTELGAETTDESAIKGAFPPVLALI